MGKMGQLLRSVGPGIVVAATGVGAGDVVAAAVIGANYGTVILWTALLGALLKWSLNEGLARWQLATGTTLLEGWMTRLPRFVSIYFICYLMVWSFVVAGALIAACGLAGHALVEEVPVWAWGVIHSLAAAALVLSGRYKVLERVMKLMIALMFAVVLYCAFQVAPPMSDLLAGIFIPRIPQGSGLMLLGVIGGVGGTVTVLSYGYWIREKGWEGPENLPRVKVDLAVGYLLTGLFGLAIMVVTAGIQPEQVAGSKMALVVADHLGSQVGAIGKWLFLVGFWAAVFSSMIGVWQGIPYLFADYLNQARRKKVARVDTSSSAYRGFLAFLALPPLVLLIFGKPIFVVLVYAVAGAFFMPFLAALLLVMNNREAWVGRFKNRLPGNLLLMVAMILFVLLFLVQVHKRFFAG